MELLQKTKDYRCTIKYITQGSKLNQYYKSIDSYNDLVCPILDDLESMTTLEQYKATSMQLKMQRLKTWSKSLNIPRKVLTEVVVRLLKLYTKEINENLSIVDYYNKDLRCILSNLICNPYSVIADCFVDIYNQLTDNDSKIALYTFFLGNLNLRKKGNDILYKYTGILHEEQILSSEHYQQIIWQMSCNPNLNTTVTIKGLEIVAETNPKNHAWILRSLNLNRFLIEHYRRIFKIDKLTTNQRYYIVTNPNFTPSDKFIKDWHKDITAEKAGFDIFFEKRVQLNPLLLKTIVGKLPQTSEELILYFGKFGTYYDWIPDKILRLPDATHDDDFFGLCRRLFVMPIDSFHNDYETTFVNHLKKFVSTEERQQMLKNCLIYRGLLRSNNKLVVASNIYINKNKAVIDIDGSNQNIYLQLLAEDPLHAHFEQFLISDDKSQYSQTLLDFLWECSFHVCIVEPKKSLIPVLYSIGQLLANWQIK